MRGFARHLAEAAPGILAGTRRCGGAAEVVAANRQAGGRGDFAPLRRDFPSADRVDHLTVINIGGNRYRLILEIFFQDQVVLVRNMLTHREYDEGTWRARSPAPASGDRRHGDAGARRAASGGVAVVGDRYLELVRSCPLRVIRAEEEYERAIGMLNQWRDRGQKRGPDETEYLLALTVFVEKYEDEHDPIAPATGAEMLRALIESREISPTDVAVGSGLAVSTVSGFLAGKKTMALDQVERLARFFLVKPSFFLDESG
jgi:antitoxin component HigA of HigAB toxin-antitoxin module